jgi:hypothetical protein
VEEEIAVGAHGDGDGDGDEGEMEMGLAAGVLQLVLFCVRCSVSGRCTACE